MKKKLINESETPTNTLILRVTTMEDDNFYDCDCAILKITPEFLEKIKNYKKVLSQISLKDFIRASFTSYDVVYIPKMLEEEIGLDSEMVDELAGGTDFMFINDDVDFEGIANLVSESEFNLKPDCGEINVSFIGNSNMEMTDISIHFSAIVYSNVGVETGSFSLNEILELA